jgi:hypothetical protein
MKIEDIAIALATENKVHDFDGQMAREWNGYIMYKDQPVAYVGGLQYYGENGSYLKLKEQVSKEERESGVEAEVYGNLNHREFEGKKGLCEVWGTRKFSFYDLVAPMTGFINNKEDGASCKLYFNKKDFDYVNSEEGKANYTSNGRELPVYKLVDASIDLDSIVMDLAALYEGFEEWYTKWFPASQTTSNFVAVADKRRELLAKAKKKPARKGKMKDVSIAEEENIPF